MSGSAEAAAAALGLVQAHNQIRADLLPGSVTKHVLAESYCDVVVSASASA